ncbi:hypothetical protein KCA24_30020, partial [Escherichia coli]|nr:hypothetical protein [Escherichia coli]
MKLVTVIIKPFKLEDVREALSSIGIQGLTVTEWKGSGRRKGQPGLSRGRENRATPSPKKKLWWGLSGHTPKKKNKSPQKGLPPQKMGPQ